MSLAKSGSNHPNWGLHHSEEVKLKIKNSCIKSKQRNYLLKNNFKKYYLTSAKLKEFCDVHKINWYSLFKAKNKQESYKEWILIELKPTN